MKPTKPPSINWSLVLAVAAWVNLFALIWLAAFGVIEASEFFLLAFVVLLGVASVTSMIMSL